MYQFACFLNIYIHCILFADFWGFFFLFFFAHLGYLQKKDDFARFWDIVKYYILFYNYLNIGCFAKAESEVRVILSKVV